MAFILATNIDRLQQSLTFHSVTLFQLSGAGLALVLAVRLLIGKPALGRQSLLTMLYLAGVFLGFVAVPVLCADGPVFVQTGTNMLRLALLWAIVSEVATDTHARWIMGAFVLASTLTGLTAIMERFVPGVADAFQGVMYHHDQYARLLGAERDPNYAALKMVMALPFALFFLAGDDERRFTRRLAGVASATLIAGLVLTGSRAGLFTLLLTLGAWLLCALGGLWRKGQRQGIVMLPFALIMLAALRLEWTNTLDRTSLTGWTPTELWQPAGGRNRWSMVEDGLAEFDRHPLCGIGSQEQGFHNSYMDLLAFYGLVGVIPLALLVGNVFWLQYSALRERQHPWDGGQKARAMAIVLSLSSWMVMGLSIGAQKELLFWAVLGLGSLSWRRRILPSAISPYPPPLRA